MPAEGRGNFHNHVKHDCNCDPLKMRRPQRFAHLGPPDRIVIDPEEQCDGDHELKNGEENFLHSPKCFFQISTERRISSALFRGLISHTNTHLRGTSGTKCARSTSPANGG